MGASIDDFEIDMERMLLNSDTKSKESLEYNFSTPAETTSAPSGYTSSVDEAFDVDSYKKHVKLYCIEPISDDSDPNATPFDCLKKKMTPVDENRGVWKRILKSGTSQVIPDGEVQIHYNSYVEMGEIPFDSTYLRTEKPVKFHLGSMETYLGFKIALQSMCVGEKSEFLIEPEYAFGKLGAPPRIPPEATILLEMEVFTSHAGKSIEEKDMEERDDPCKFEKVYGKAVAIHTVAKDLFNQRNIHKAAAEYRYAANILQNSRLTNDDEEKNMKKLLQKTYTNLMTCYNRLGSYERTCSIAHEFVYINPNVGRENPKFCYQLAKAKFELNDYTKALRLISVALRLLPNDPLSRSLKEKIEQRRTASNEEEKIMYRRALGVSSKENLEKVKESNFRKMKMTDQELATFITCAQRLISSCLTSNEPVAITQTFTDDEFKKLEELCKESGVELKVELISGLTKYYLAKTRHVKP